LENSFLRLFGKLDRPGGAQFFANSALPFLKVQAMGSIDGIFQGNGLGIFQVDGLAISQSCVKLIPHLAGTFLRAETAGDASIHIHIPGRLPNLNFKFPGLPYDPLYFG
jgi:hypothetical protein